MDINLKYVKVEGSNIGSDNDLATIKSYIEAERRLIDGIGADINGHELEWTDTLNQDEENYLKQSIKDDNSQINSSLPANANVVPVETLYQNWPPNSAGAGLSDDNGTETAMLVPSPKMVDVVGSVGAPKTGGQCSPEQKDSVAMLVAGEREGVHHARQQSVGDTRQ